MKGRLYHAFKSSIYIADCNLPLLLQSCILPIPTKSYHVFKHTNCYHVFIQYTHQLLSCIYEYQLLSSIYTIFIPIAIMAIGSPIITHIWINTAIIKHKTIFSIPLKQWFKKCLRSIHKYILALTLSIMSKIKTSSTVLNKDIHKYINIIKINNFVNRNYCDSAVRDA